jgi:hypothetical protein
VVYSVQRYPAIVHLSKNAYSPTTVAPSSNAYDLERSSARTVFAISWLSPSAAEYRLPMPADGAARSEFDRAAP